MTRIKLLRRKNEIKDAMKSIHVISGKEVQFRNLSELEIAHRNISMMSDVVICAVEEIKAMRKKARRAKCQ